MPAKSSATTQSSKAIVQSSSEEKVKPKKVLSPYLCFTTANVKKIAEKENLPFTQAIKKAAEMWNALNDKAKEPYLKMQAKDQLRYDNEMSQFNKTGYFTNKEGVCSSTLKAKVKKNKGDKIEIPVIPKRVCTPYTYWIKVNARDCMEKNKISMTEAGSLLSK